MYLVLVGIIVAIVVCYCMSCSL